MDDRLVLETMRMIQQYLDSRPESADTLDGIHYSWIQSQESKDVTQAALDRLLEAGVVEHLRYGRNTLLWRRARKTAG
jgi:hypothetical protein